MKKRVTYEIYGQVERNCFFKMGKAVYRVEFTGGAINSAGVVPAKYTTDNPLLQRSIEASDIFKSGQIRRGREEMIEQVAAVDDGDSVEQDADNEGKCFPEVTNMQQARALLMAAPFAYQLSQLQSKAAIKAIADKDGIVFPNWL